MAETSHKAPKIRHSTVSIISRPIPQIFAEHRGSIFKWFARLTFVCLVGYCVVGAVMLPYGSVKLIPNQQENTYPESSILYEATLSAKTGHLYFPLLERPYLSQPYGPVFYAVNRLIASSAGLDQIKMMTRARSGIFLAFLMCGVIIFLINCRLGVPTVHAALSGLLMLGFPTFLYWNVSVRPDIPCLLAMLLCIFISLFRGHRNAAVCAAGIFAAISYLIKQTGIAAALAVLGVLVWKRKYQEARLFLASSVVPVAVTIGILAWRHEPFLSQWNSVAKGALWSISQGASWSAEELTRLTVLIPLVLGGAGFATAVRKSEQAQVVATFAAVTWAIFAATISQRGAGHNYLLPGLACCALLLPSAIEFIRFKMRVKWILLPIAAALAWASWSTVEQEKRLFWGRLNSQPISYSALQPFRILSDNPYFTLQGRDPELLDPFLFHSLELAGEWSSAPIAEELRRGDIDLVILSCSWRSIVCSYRGIAFFSPELLDVISTDYVVLCSTPRSWVLRQQNRQLNLAPSNFDQILGARCGTGQRGKQVQLELASGIR